MTPPRPLAAGLDLDTAIAAYLGWTRTDHEGGLWVEPDTRNLHYELPRFSTEWAAGGPLIARYNIELIPVQEGYELTPMDQQLVPDYWCAAANPNALSSGYWYEVYLPDWVRGATPLEAVCRAVLALDSPAPPPVE